MKKIDMKMLTDSIPAVSVFFTSDSKNKITSQNSQEQKEINYSDYVNPIILNQIKNEIVLPTKIK